MRDGPVTAMKIIESRATTPFTSINDLRDRKLVGEKAFEQSAGFLRIRDGRNPLDASAVHPEAYPVVERILADIKADPKKQAIFDRLTKLNDALRDVELESYLKAGILTADQVAGLKRHA